MMKTRTFFLALFLMVSIRSYGQVPLQQTPFPAADTTQKPGEMPKLEIPEITIVGKKAITLPFARKGEIFDVEVYEAPAPDSSMLLTRPSLPFPVGQYNKYEERHDPWRIAVDGEAGSFATFGGNGYVNYKSPQWDISGGLGFINSQSRSIDNYFAANPSSMNVAASNAHGEFTVGTLLSTDNDILKTLRLSLGSKFNGDLYHYFGYNGIESKRMRQHTFLDGGLGSVNREGMVIDFNLSANLWNFTDSKAAMPDSQISLVFPTITAGLATDFGRFRFINDLEYEGTSLDYQHPTQSPTALNLSSALRWQVMDRWFLQAGAYYGYATESDGGSRMLLMPSATLRWDIDASREVSFWWKPEMKLENYDQLADENPYLDREIVLRPRRTPINFGGSFWFNGNMMTFEASGSFRQSSDRDVILSQRGEMTVAYLDAVESIAEFKGSLAPAKPFIVSYSGQIDRAVATNGDTQLPMIPLMKLHGAAEMDLRLPAKIYVSSDYTSPRNVDFPGTRQLSSTLLFGAGISSNVFNNLVLSFDIANLLNTSYFLWEGYAAPGITFTAGLKYNIQ